MIFFRLTDAGVSGIIAPSIPGSDWVRYNGEEPGVAITGDEDIPFALMTQQQV